MVIIGGFFQKLYDFRQRKFRASYVSAFARVGTDDEQNNRCSNETLRLRVHVSQTRAVDVGSAHCFECLQRRVVEACQAKNYCILFLTGNSLKTFFRVPVVFFLFIQVATWKRYRDKCDREFRVTAVSTGGICVTWICFCVSRWTSLLFHFIVTFRNRKGQPTMKPEVITLASTNPTFREL